MSTIGKSVPLHPLIFDTMENKSTYESWSNSRFIVFCLLDKSKSHDFIFFLNKKQWQKVDTTRTSRVLLDIYQ